MNVKDYTGAFIAGLKASGVSPITTAHLAALGDCLATHVAATEAALGTALSELDAAKQALAAAPVTARPFAVGPAPGGILDSNPPLATSGG